MRSSVFLRKTQITEEIRNKGRREMRETGWYIRELKIAGVFTSQSVANQSDNSS